MNGIRGPLATEDTPPRELGTLSDRVVNRVVALVALTLVAWLVVGSAYLIAAMDLTVLSAFVLVVGLVLSFLGSRLVKTPTTRRVTWFALMALPIIAFVYAVVQAISG